MAPRDDVNYFKKLEAEKRALDDIWSSSTDHRTIQFWNKTDEWIELTGSFSSQFGPSSINCVTKVCLWPRKSYTWRFMGDNFDTQLNVGGGGENSRLTNYAAFMLGIVLPDSYSQSLANNYKWHSKVLNFHHENFQHPSNESSSDDTSNGMKDENGPHVESLHQKTCQTQTNSHECTANSFDMTEQVSLNFTLCCTSKKNDECIYSCPGNVQKDVSDAYDSSSSQSINSSASSNESVPSQRSHPGNSLSESSNCCSDTNCICQNDLNSDSDDPSHYNAIDDLLQDHTHTIISDNADDSKNSDKNNLALDGDNILSHNKEEGGNESHIHSISSARNMGIWSNLLAIHDLPSIAPLQEANIILSSNVVTSLQILTTSTILSAVQRKEENVQLLPLPKRIKTFLNDIMLNTT